MQGVAKHRHAVSGEANSASSRGSKYSTPDYSFVHDEDCFAMLRSCAKQSDILGITKVLDVAAKEGLGPLPSDLVEEINGCIGVGKELESQKMAEWLDSAIIEIWERIMQIQFQTRSLASAEKPAAFEEPFAASDFYRVPFAFPRDQNVLPFVTFFENDPIERSGDRSAEKNVTHRPPAVPAEFFTCRLALHAASKAKNIEKVAQIMKFLASSTVCTPERARSPADDPKKEGLALWDSLLSSFFFAFRSGGGREYFSRLLQAQRPQNASSFIILPAAYMQAQSNIGPDSSHNERDLVDALVAFPSAFIGMLNALESNGLTAALRQALERLAVQQLTASASSAAASVSPEIKMHLESLALEQRIDPGSLSQRSTVIEDIEALLSEGLPIEKGAGESEDNLDVIIDDRFVRVLRAIKGTLAEGTLLTEMVQMIRCDPASRKENSHERIRALIDTPGRYPHAWTAITDRLCGADSSETQVTSEDSIALLKHFVNDKALRSAVLMEKRVFPLMHTLLRLGCVSECQTVLHEFLRNATQLEGWYDPAPVQALFKALRDGGHHDMLVKARRALLS